MLTSFITFKKIYYLTYPKSKYRIGQCFLSTFYPNDTSTLADLIWDTANEHIDELCYRLIIAHGDYWESLYIKDEGLYRQYRLSRRPIGLNIIEPGCIS